MDKEYLKEAARVIEAKFPDNYGFILLVTPFAESGRLNYISSMERKCAINVLKEFLIKATGEEEWLKHVK